MSKLRLAFAGDRDIAVWVLDFLLSQDVCPLALLLPDESKASHAQDLRSRCSCLSEENILVASPASTILPRHSTAMYSPIWRAEAMLCVTTR